MPTTETELDHITRLLDRMDAIQADKMFLRDQLSWLVGYYLVDGAVPVEVLERVLADMVTPV